MYKDIYQLKQRGYRVRRIARKLRIPRSKIYKYVEKSPQEVTKWMKSSNKQRKLDRFEMLAHTWLSERPKLSNTQIHKRLQIQDPNLDVSISTVGSFVKDIRSKYSIPKDNESEEGVGA